MLAEGHSFLEKLSEDRLLEKEQLTELDVDSVRKFVEVHLQKDACGLRHVEQLIGRSETKVSRNKLRLLLAFYLELLRQCASQSVQRTNFYADPTVLQFLRQFQYILTGEGAYKICQTLDDHDEDDYRKWVHLLLGELVCEMFVELWRAGTKVPPFDHDFGVQLISSLLASESTRIARRPAIERTAVAMLNAFCDSSSDDSLFSSLVRKLVQADFFIVVESISRVLETQKEILGDALISDRRVILRKAAQTQRIGPAFAELIAEIIFATSTNPANIAFEDRHGFSLVLAKLAELLAADKDGRCNLSRRTMFELLARSSEWNLGLIGPLLPQYSGDYGTKSELLEFLLMLVPSLVRRDHQPCSDTALSAVIEALIFADPLMETIPVAFEQLIPHLLDPHLSAFNFFCDFCKTVQKLNPNSDRLQQLFIDHPNLNAQLTALVSSQLISGESNCSSAGQFQWEREHSALELMIACHWIVPNILNHSAMRDRLLRCSLNESNAFLCGPALRILCKHLPSQTAEHWPRIYAQNFEATEVKSDLLSHILQSVGTLSNSLPLPAELTITSPDRLTIAKNADEVLDKMEQMLEDEDSEQCIGGRQRKREELLQQKRWREWQKGNLCAMMETLVPAMNSDCSMNAPKGEEGTKLQQLSRREMPESRREFNFSDSELLSMMAVLQVGPKVDAKGLRNAFFMHIKEHHSDKGGTVQKSQEITRAYRVLKQYIDASVLLPGSRTESKFNGSKAGPSSSRSGCRPTSQGAQGPSDEFEDFGDFEDVGGKRRRRRGTDQQRDGHNAQPNGDERSSGTTNGTSAGVPGSSRKFINNYTYEPDDFSTYNDPMDKKDRQKDGIRKLRGGLLLYKDFQRGQTLPSEFQEMGTVYSEDDLVDDPIFEPILSKLQIPTANSSSMHAFVEKLRTFVFICWAFDGGASQDARIVLQNAKLNQISEDDDALYEIKVPSKSFDEELLTSGLHVEVRVPSDARQCASAVIEKVKLGRVLNASKQVNVAINCSAFVYRSQLRSIEYMENAKHGRDMAQLVFPKLTFSESFEQFEQKRARELNEMTFRDDQSHNYNAEQKNAIYSIVSKAHNPWPFILFGPPGTGKTITLIESIRHLVLQSPQNRILVCTPSKMAADNFADALLDHNFLEPKYAFRMHSLSTMAFNRNKKLDSISYLAKEAKNRFFGIPDRHNLKMFRVIISTLSTASYLISAGGLRGFFTHVIVDEASQATEADNWIPIGGLVGPQTSVVLAGDPKQLGPVVRPENLKWFGFDSSMMKRIMYGEEYSQADDRVFVTLKQTYRSHYAILRPCSYLFYDNILQVDDGQGEFHKLTEWSGLPTKGFPVIFHSSRGSKDEQGLNKSHQNQFEADLVRQYVERILEETNTNEKSIGVISPYRNQMMKLRHMMGCYPGVTVDSVEGFQGSEREVIIISTVRQMDIGFLRCDLRLNTSISRAKYLLIVIGNEELLSQHITWKKFVYYCRFHGGFLNRDGEKLEQIENNC
uniref:RNA helicase n=1 Tax=Globodera rostochiensis TaxID=31243 RepID=A0A914GRM9_GLORO